MAGNNLTIRLDTTPPTGLAVAIDSGSIYTSDTLVDVNITFDAPIDESNTSLWQMLIWSADIDPAYNTKVQATELTSDWITYQNPFQIRLAEGDGPKTISVRLRDEVFNSTGIATANITLDATKPIVTVTNPDVTRISEIDTKNLAHFSFTCDVPFAEYQVRVVGSAGDNYLSGTLIPTTNGSINTSGTGTFTTATDPIPVTIHGTDLKTASTGDGPKIIKVFCRDDAENWSA
jgi:hypothetical protein